MEDSLGDRMKSYEVVSRNVLMPNSHMILRVDGRAFHSYLRDAVKPFDLEFQGAMMNVGIQMAEEIPGTKYVYGQSDEISLVLDDTERHTQPWFGGAVQKIVSVAAGLATAALISQRGSDRLPHFDARVFNVPNLGEVENYLIWRQRDAIRNSVTMAAQTKFTPKELHEKSFNQRQEMLWSVGINWNDYPDSCKRGWVVEREIEFSPLPAHYQGITDESTVMVERTRWVSKSAPNFVYGFLSPPVFLQSQPQPPMSAEELEELRLSLSKQRTVVLPRSNFDVIF